MKRGFILLSLLLLATACERNTYSTYSNKNKVFFSCETSISPYNQLTTPGRFLAIRKGDGKLIITDSDGNKFEEPLTAIQSGSFIFGLAGLIVGTPMLNNDDMSIWAFDLGCPECDSPGTRIKFDLTGNASCAKCGGTWSLNTNGFPTDDKSRPLYRYPTSFNNGILTVSN
ncbi:MAG: hypothetical protein J5596_05910 [Bacteroidaceae bacterium]|nr:hypothetical protein [Bacteroidaceae bacterium]